MDIILSTGERVPPLADTAVVHEDGAWTVKRNSTIVPYFLYKKSAKWWNARGFIWRNPSLRQWEAVVDQRSVFHGDLHEALAALWAARGG